jgi:hypothetical protein
MSAGEVRAAAGLSAVAALGGLDEALRGARLEADANGNAPGSDATYTKGALVLAATGPAVAPFIGARVGIGSRFEGGLSYTGRSVRADVRRSFELTPHWDASLGVGGTGVLYGHPERTDLPGVDLDALHGVGADLPVLVGYASEEDLYAFWLGLRAGWQQVHISALSSEPQGVSVGAQPISLTVTDLSAGGLLGAAVGFRHLHVAMEVALAYAHLVGSYGTTHADVSGLVVVPASCLWWSF